MQPNLVTYFFLALGVCAFIAWLRERRSTELYATVAESLGMFLFTSPSLPKPLGCGPLPDPRSLCSLKPGLIGVMFEFADGGTLCVSLAVSGSLFKKTRRVDLVLAPGASGGALHVTMSADDRPPVFDGEVRLSEATMQAPFYLGSP